MKRSGYVTYGENGGVPHIDARLRERSRYGGVGDTAGDGIAEFLDDPDQIADDALEGMLKQVEAPVACDVSAGSGAAAAPDAPAPAAAAARGFDFGGVGDALAFDFGDIDEAPDGIPGAREGARADAGSSRRDARSSADDTRYAKFAQFRNVYESRDGRLCVFEDESGHLVAVNSERLA